MFSKKVAPLQTPVASKGSHVAPPGTQKSLPIAAVASGTRLVLLAPTEQTIDLPASDGDGPASAISWKPIKKNELFEIDHHATVTQAPPRRLLHARAFCQRRPSKVDCGHPPALQEALSTPSSASASRSTTTSLKSPFTPY